MKETEEFSRTIRIDLIPETPKAPIRNKKRIVVSTTSKSGNLSSATPAVEPAAELPEQSRYTALLESIYDAAIITDLLGNILDANTRAVDFLQWSKFELTEKTTIANVISGAEESLLGNLSRDLERQRFVLIQAYCQRKDGSQFPSEIAVSRLRTGEESLGFFIRDITVRRQAEEMLRTEHNAIQNSANGIAIANLEGVLEYVNPAFAQMLESESQNDLIGISIKDLFDGSSMADDLMSVVLGDAGSWSGEVSADMPSGKTLDLQIMANSNRNSDGEKVGVVFSFADLSDRKRAEAVEREIERNRVMLESLGAACHHLGQPATVLTCNLSLLHKMLEDSNPTVQEILKTSAEAIERLGKTLHKLNEVNEYRTTSYIDNTSTLGAGSKILDI